VILFIREIFNFFPTSIKINMCCQLSDIKQRSEWVLLELLLRPSLYLHANTYQDFCFLMKTCDNFLHVF